MVSGSQWDSGSHPESGSALAPQESELASGSALVTDSEYHSASDSAQAPASELDSDLVQVSEPAPDSVTDSVPDSATYSALQPD